MLDLRAMLAGDVAVDAVTDRLADDTWWVEEKLDGARILLHGGKDLPVQAFNRDGHTSKFAPEFATGAWQRFFALAAPHGTGILDGEYVDGVLHVFDVPRWMELITPEHSYEQRRALLDALSVMSSPMRAVAPARTFEDKTALVQRCLAEGAEGIIFRHLDSPYVAGPRRAPGLGKVKFTKTVDARVSRVAIDGKHNVGLAVSTPDGDTEIGKASTIGKGPITPGDIVEVRYLAFSEAGRLVQPRIVRIRDDKTTPDSLQKVQADAPTSSSAVDLVQTPDR